jgi:VanZ family protein
VTQRSRGAAFVAIYSAMYVLAGLYPFDFDFARTFRVFPIGTPADVVWNIAAFVPFGCAFAAARMTRRPRFAAVVFCTALACCVEFVQAFVPERFPQISDVVCNAAGALIGAALWPLLALPGAMRPRPTPGTAAPRESPAVQPQRPVPKNHSP